MRVARAFSPAGRGQLVGLTDEGEGLRPGAVSDSHSPPSTLDNETFPGFQSPHVEVDRRDETLHRRTDIQPDRRGVRSTDTEPSSGSHCQKNTQ